MYKSFYKLNFDPFQPQAESPFFWKNDRLESLVGRLKKSVLEQRGFFLLTGEKGVGKTYLIDRLLESVEERTANSYVPVKTVDRIAFYNQILSGFGLDVEVTAKIQFYIQITNHLQGVQRTNRIGLLVIDSAHLLSQELLDELRHISNIEHDGVKLINILLAGEPELTELLGKQQNRAIQQNIKSPLQLHCFSEAEVKQYVKFRLKVAGSEAKIFTEKGLAAVAHYSRGLVRVINSLCETALITGHKQDSKTIGEQEVRDGAVQLKLMEKDAGSTASSGMKKGRQRRKMIKEQTLVQNGDGYDGDSSNKKISWMLTIFVSSIVSIAVLLYLVPELWQIPMGDDVGGTRLNMGTEDAVDEDVMTRIAHSITAAEELVEEIQVGGKEIVTDSDNQQVKVSGSVAVIENEKGQNSGLEGEANQASEIQETVSQKIVTITPVANKLVSPEVTPSDSPPESEVEGSETQSKPLHVSTDSQTDKENSVQDNRPVLLQGVMILETRPNSSSVTDEAQAELKQFGERLLLYPEALIQIEGYIASKRNSPENIKLSEKRAGMVRDFLVKQGVGADQIIVKGMGNQNPRGNNDTREGRRKNRRVEIFVID